MSRFNLLLDDFEDVARFVLNAVRGEGGRYGVYVADDGAVRVLPTTASRPDPRPDSELVATYCQPLPPINVIEDDLLEKRRELSALPKKRR